MKCAQWLRAMTVLVASGVVLIPPPVAQAQSLLPSTGWSVSPAITVWHFAQPITQPTGNVSDVALAAMPILVRASWSGWHADISAATVFGAVRVTTPDGDGHGSVISGPTDAKLRISGPIIGDATLLTIGVNLPTGKTRLNSDQTAALQILAAPALNMPVSSFGTGAGATLGVVRAFHGDDWAVALGASAEKRTEYTPISLALSSGRAETQLTPGLAAHVSVGLDKTVGNGRWSSLVIADLYAKDAVHLTDVPTDTSNNYTQGPQISALTQFDFGAGGWRQSAVSLGGRARSQFSDAVGKKVAGSSGTYIEGALSGVLGAPEGFGLVLGTDARVQSGLKFTPTMVGAATSGVGATLGLEYAGASTATRFTIHGSYASFDTGVQRTTGIGVTVGLSIGARREVH